MNFYIKKSIKTIPFLSILLLIGCYQTPTYEKEVIEETIEYPKAENYASEVSDIPGRNGINQDAIDVEPEITPELKTSLDSIYYFKKQNPSPE